MNIINRTIPNNTFITTTYLNSLIKYNTNVNMEITFVYKKIEKNKSINYKKRVK